MSQLHATLGTRTHHSSAEISHPSHAKLASCSSYYVNAIRHGPSSFLSLENPQRMQPMSLYRRLSLNCRKSQVIDIIQQPSETDRSNDQQTGRQASRQISNNYPKTTNIFLKTHVATIKLKDITWKSSPNVELTNLKCSMSYYVEILKTYHGKNNITLGFVSFILQC